MKLREDMTRKKMPGRKRMAKIMQDNNIWLSREGRVDVGCEGSGAELIGILIKNKEGGS